MRRALPQTRESTRRRVETQSSAFSRGLLFPYRVADAPNGVDKFLGSGPIDLRPQLPNEDIECIVLDLFVVAPNSLNQSRARDDSCCIPHEMLENQKLSPYQ